MWRLNRVRGIDTVHRISIRRIKKSKNNEKPSRNTRLSSELIRKKFGIKIPNTVKEALLLDKINRDTKWYDVIMKEMKALEKLNVSRFHPNNYKMPKEF